MYRDNTKVVKIGNVAIGGGNKIAIQSMTNTKTEDVKATVEQILALEKGKGLKISCGEGTLYIVTAQFPNSKKMNVEDYARGHELEFGVVLGKE